MGRLWVQHLAKAAGKFSSAELTLSADTFSIRSPPMLRLWHVKDSGHSAKSARGRLHVNAHTPMTQQSRSGQTVMSRYSVGSYQGNELTCSLSGKACPQLAEPLWSDSGI